MVQTFIYENLLSHSKHRDYYVKLFEISITRRKQVDQKFSDKISIVKICNDLMKETNRKAKQNGDGARKKFYVTSQLIFGTVMLYKCQADNLLTKVKAALVSCEFKFSNLNLSQSSTFSKTVNGKKHKNNPNPPRELNFYEDLDEAVFKTPVIKKSKKSDDHDATMVRNAQSITILESRMNQTPFTNTSILPDIPENEFSALTQNELELFFGEEDQTIHNQTTAGNLTVNSEVPLNETSLQPALETFTLNPIGDPVSQIEIQSPKTRGVKRALAEDLEESTKHPRLLEDLDEIQTLNEESNGISKFDFQANEPNVINVPEVNIQNESQPKSLKSEHQDPVTSPRKRTSTSEIDSEDFKLPKIRKTVKKDVTVKKPRKLILEKFTKISTKQMDDQLKFYGDLMTPMPRSEFNFKMLDFKMNMNNYLPNPLHRNLNEEILYLYRRNLKKVPNHLAKKRITKPLNKKKGSDHQEELPESSTNLPPQIQTDLLQENQMNLLQDIEELPQIPPEVAKNVPENPVLETPRKKLFDGSQVYEEKDKWSQEQILAKLFEFWEEKSGPINMETLELKNRFVFAGVFHELLVLNKMEVVELIQVEGNSEIYDIRKGKNFDQEFEVNIC